MSDAQSGAGAGPERAFVFEVILSFREPSSPEAARAQRGLVSGIKYGVNDWVGREEMQAALRDAGCTGVNVVSSYSYEGSAYEPPVRATLSSIAEVISGVE